MQAKVPDRLFLLALGMIFILSRGDVGAAVVALLLAILVVSLEMILDFQRGRGFLLLCSALLLLIFPWWAAFLPLLLYGCCEWDFRWIGLFAGVVLCHAPFLLQAFLSPALLAVWGAVALLAIWMAVRAGRLERLRREIIRLRDTDAELQMVLREKNRNLLEKQEYEIHLATLRERNRIAREIHDNVGHLLSRSILQVGALRAVYREEPLREQLADVSDALSQAMDSIRESVHDLRDDAVDLQKNVLEMLAPLRVQYQVRLEYDMSGQVPGEIKACFLMVLKEALANFSRHSNGDRISVALREHPALYQLVVEDNGAGGAAVGEGGMGLQNMRERVEALSGTFLARQDGGFKIFVSVWKKGTGEETG